MAPVYPNFLNYWISCLIRAQGRTSQAACPRDVGEGDERLVPGKDLNPHSPFWPADKRANRSRPAIDCFVSFRHLRPLQARRETVVRSVPAQFLLELRHGGISIYQKTLDSSHFSKILQMLCA